MNATEQETYDALPVERMSQAAFDSLPEYSCSDPTGVYAGKVWRCNLNAYRSPPGTPAAWVLREYVPTNQYNEGCRLFRIECRRPVITDPKPVTA